MTQRFVALLFTDIEGSTSLWEREPQRMALALARHDMWVREAVVTHNGIVVKMTGDGVHAVFDDPVDSVLAAVRLQQMLAESDSTVGLTLRVRSGLHIGAVQVRDADYFGTAANRAARIMSSANGGQILLSQAIVDQTRDRLPTELALRDLGLVHLRDLASPEHVYEVLVPGLPHDFPPLRGLDSAPHNLPQQASSFIGRDQDIENLGRLLASNRLVTLVGPGGVGKTRLSLQVAASLLDEFCDGVWFVELAPIAESALVVTTLAQVLCVREQPGEPLEQTLLSHLATRRLLIVLDNCEHLLDDCAHLVAKVMAATSRVCILASSRSPLRIPAERRYPLAALSLERAAEVEGSRMMSDAARLFVERTLGNRPDFVLTDRATEVVERICTRLDGIPLAIELAAARTPAMALEDIQLKLDDRFSLLTLGSRSALPRQQTLHALVNWSYELLSPSEQRLLARVSIFASGFGLAAAEQVCGYSPVSSAEVLDFLGSLVEKSLVIADTKRETTRYRLLETIRQFATERLREFDEVDRTAERHADYFRCMAREAHARLLGHEVATWMRRLTSEHDNLRAALNWSTQRVGSALIGLNLAAHLYRFWQLQRYLTEGRERLRAVLNRPDASEPTSERAAALHAAGVLASAQNDDAQARRLFDASLAIHRSQGNKLGVAAALLGLGNADPERAFEHRTRALEIYTVAGDRAGQAQALLSLGLAAMEKGDSEIGTRSIEESMTLCRQLGYVTLEVTCELCFGFFKLKHSLPREAMEHFSKSRDIASASQLLPSVASAYRGLALAASELCDWPAACNAARTAFTTRMELPARSPADLPRDLLADVLYVCARIAFAFDDVEAALRLLAASGALGPWRDKTGRFSVERFEQERLTLFDMIAHDTARRLWQEGSTCTIEETVRFALAKLDGVQQTKLDQVGSAAR